MPAGSDSLMILFLIILSTWHQKGVQSGSEQADV